MNKNTHKTIRVNATMHTDLYADINVPIDIDENDIWQFIRDGAIDGGDIRDAIVSMRIAEKNVCNPC